jgi:Uma2 family endonuclease
MIATPTSLPIIHPADHQPGSPQGRWTYAAYAALPDDGNRYEVIDGVLYMAPAPIPAHQATTALIVFHLLQHVQFAGRGRIFPAPVDVELAPNVVVQPDVLVILTPNMGIITPTRIIGAPDLVVEVSSPGTAGYDRRQKQDAYARGGVAEYWIADPIARMIEVLVLEPGGYRLLGVFQGATTLPSHILPNLPVPVEQFFA